jgi:hypothetical protein
MCQSRESATEWRIISISVFRQLTDQVVVYKQLESAHLGLALTLQVRSISVFRKLTDQVVVYKQLE